MGTIMAVILLIVIAAIASAIMFITHGDTKRGCGHGCATCPNRSMCHKTEKSK